MFKKVFFSLGDYSAAKILRAVLKKMNLENFKLYGITNHLLEDLIEPVERVENISATGLVEIIPKLPKIIAARRRVEKFLKEKEIDVLVALDAPGFNLGLIKKAKKLGVKKVIYFILPQIWAWKERRKYTLAKYCDVLISIIPIERKYFKEFTNIRFYYEGNPLVDLVKPPLPPEEARKKFRLPQDYFVIFPGSRENEVKKHREVLLEAIPTVKRELEFQPVVLGFKHLRRELRPFLKEAKVVYLDRYPEMGYSIILGAHFGWIKSGTTAFETALLGVPHLIFYRVNPLTYWIGKRLAKVKYLHLANILLGREIFPELIQDKFTPEALIAETYRLVETKDNLTHPLETLRRMLNPHGGSVVERIALLLQKEIETAP